MSRRGFKPPSIHYLRIGKTHGTIIPTRIIIHGTQNQSVKGPSDVLAIPAFWARQGKGYNSHLIMDGEGITCRGASDNRLVWATGGSNSGSLQVEFVSSVSDGKVKWEARTKGVKQLAKWLAYWHRTWNIPLTRSVTRGVGTHLDHSLAFHKTTHTDPGPQFPFNEMMRYAKYYSRFGWHPEPNA